MGLPGSFILFWILSKDIQCKLSLVATILILGKAKWLGLRGCFLRKVIYCKPSLFWVRFSGQELGAVIQDNGCPREIPKYNIHIGFLKNKTPLKIVYLCANTLSRMYPEHLPKAVSLWKANGQSINAQIISLLFWVGIFCMCGGSLCAAPIGILKGLIFLRQVVNPSLHYFWGGVPLGEV